MSNAPRLRFLKGHGTENDFVIVPDLDGQLELSAAAVVRICDRRAGVGGDGLIRVVRSSAHPEARAMAAEAERFMDYRNSDGSIAEMCGNGVRGFARYLQRAGLAEEGDLTIATRAGLRHIHIAKAAGEPGNAGEPGGAQAAGADGGAITVGMGKAVLPEPGPDGGITVGVG